jgi:hypothetical protein
MYRKGERWESAAEEVKLLSPADRLAPFRCTVSFDNPIISAVLVLEGRET